VYFSDAGWFEDTDPASGFALSVDNFDTLLIKISRLSPVVLTWPGSSHPVGITDNKETLEEVVGLTVNYKEPNGPTTFTLAGSFYGPFYYFCKNHLSMGVHEIIVKAGSCVSCATDTFNAISGAASCEACHLRVAAADFC